MNAPNYLWITPSRLLEKVITNFEDCLCMTLEISLKELFLKMLRKKG